MALLTGLADLGGVWPTETTLAAMSATADAVLQEATAFLFRKARDAGQIAAQADAAPTPGYFIIAMGKLGAFELNYSSDIDIIVFYDADRAGLKPDIEPSTFFVRLTRELVRLLQEHTADGYVFRTDLRLRPDPGATQIALSTDAGLTYYESFGQNWERAALIKARIAAGDLASGEEFLGQLAPFVWRKYLDYAAIADIHAMKRRVHAYKGHGAIAVEGTTSSSAGAAFAISSSSPRPNSLSPEAATQSSAPAAPSRRLNGSPKEAGSERGGKRSDRSLSFPAPRREPAADGRRPADPYHSRRARRARARREALGLCRYRLLRRRVARRVQARWRRHYGALFEKLPEPPRVGAALS